MDDRAQSAGEGEQTEPLITGATAMNIEFRIIETGNRAAGAVVLGIHVVDVDSGPMKIYADKPVPLRVEGTTYAEAYDRLQSLLAECNAAMDKPPVSDEK
jgi:hypothetical protein